ncbi:MAG: hypothetical protein CMP53_07535 [Flavobacteriales bacterium]|jgi:uncharacterized membrane protein affecting hemolysin expression|nr:hypothetical protein [Flavobacteriales bacterium]|tara:strand:+ start:9113 stop:9325 length:213 start_codon:yes stop_codon:yes gene_type:complete
MGPYSEEKQYQRAASIKRLLDTNPQLDELTRAMWQQKAQNLAMTEERYNARVKAIFSNIKRQPYTVNFLC